MNPTPPNPPTPIVWALGEDRCGEILAVAEAQAARRRYAEGRGPWHRGMMGEIEDPAVGPIDRVVRPVYAGLLGETAVADWLSRELGREIRPDFSARRWGDGGRDLVDPITGFAIQVKTRQHAKPEAHVRCEIDAAGRPVVEAADAVVFCRWLRGDRVELLGYLPGWEMVRLDPVASHYGEWCNVVPKDGELCPLPSLPPSILRAEISTRAGMSPVRG